MQRNAFARNISDETPWGLISTTDRKRAFVTDRYALPAECALAKIKIDDGESPITFDNNLFRTLIYAFTAARTGIYEIIFQQGPWRTNILHLLVEITTKKLPTTDCSSHC